MEKQHGFKHLGKPYFELILCHHCYLSQMATTSLYCDDAIVMPLHRIFGWAGQGEGFKVEFLDSYPGQTLLVKWKDLQDIITLETWQLSTHANTLAPVSFGWSYCSMMESKCDFLDEALCAVSGDLMQTLCVLLEFDRTSLSLYQ
jgi:hypothetical protein